MHGISFVRFSCIFFEKAILLSRRTSNSSFEAAECRGEVLDDSVSCVSQSHEQPNPFGAMFGVSSAFDEHDADDGWVQWTLPANHRYSQHH